MTGDPHLLDPDHRPTPFSAEEIRLGCPPGRTIRSLVERRGADPVIRVIRFLMTDAEGADQEAWNQTLDGRLLAEPERRRSTWLDFQGHASMPAAETEITEETIEIPAGRFDCLVYTRTDEDGVMTFWFARGVAGQPVKFEQRVDGEVVFSSTMIENETPGA